MTVTIELSLKEEMQLEQRAQEMGVQPGAYLRQVVIRDLAQAEPRAKKRGPLQLLREWRDEAAEAEKRQETERALNQHRSSHRLMFTAFILS